MKMALEELLGAPCYHMVCVLRSRKHLELWLRVVRSGGKDVDADALFDGFKAAVDVPAALYYKELMEAFPNAKVVLSMRDPDKWYNSVMDTLFENFTLNKLPWHMRPFLPEAVLHRRMVDECFYTGIFEGRIEDREFAKQKYLEHVEEVKRVVPADRLLLFNLADGWGPLCKFLGVPVPDVPFPHINDTAQFKAMTGGMRRERWRVGRRRQAMAAAAAIAAAVAGLWLWRGGRIRAER